MTKVSKFKVGDRVSVIDDQVEGKVSRIDQSRIYIIDDKYNLHPAIFWNELLD